VADSEHPKQVEGVRGDTIRSVFFFVLVKSRAAHRGRPHVSLANHFTGTLSGSWTIAIRRSASPTTPRPADPVANGAAHDELEITPARHEGGAADGRA